MNGRLLIVCNAIDDATRLERGIHTDSPAASRKIFMMARAIRDSGGQVCVVSLGRGRPDRSGRFFPGSVRRVRGVPVIYMPFSHSAVFSRIISLVAPIPLLVRLSSTGGNVILFYNRMLAYVPTLFVARLLGFRASLDLEDGELSSSAWSVRRTGSRLIKMCFEYLCSGALLACEALSEQTRIRPLTCYYGTVAAMPTLVDWAAPQLSVLLGGTVSRDTGALQLIEAIKILHREKPPWAARLRFSITGRGDCVHMLAALAGTGETPSVDVYGRTGDSDYAAILARSHVGLALKPRAGDLAYSTFPSKVVELANAGLLVITTDISDVRKVLDSHALYLENGDPRELIDRLRWTEANRRSAEAVAHAGTRSVREVCDPDNAGQRLLDFLMPSSTCSGA